MGIVSAAWVGDFAVRMGRRRTFSVLVLLIVGGVLLTLASDLAIMPRRHDGAHLRIPWRAFGRIELGRDRGKTAKAQASSLYLFSDYAGSSVLGRFAWEPGGWPAVVKRSSIILALAFGLALALVVNSRHRRSW